MQIRFNLVITLDVINIKYTYSQLSKLNYKISHCKIIIHTPIYQIFTFSVFIF